MTSARMPVVPTLHLGKTSTSRRYHGAPETCAEVRGPYTTHTLEELLESTRRSYLCHAPGCIQVLDEPDLRDIEYNWGRCRNLLATPEYGTRVDEVHALADLQKHLDGDDWGRGKTGVAGRLLHDMRDWLQVRHDQWRQEMQDHHWQQALHRELHEERRQRGVEECLLTLGLPPNGQGILVGRRRRSAYGTLSEDLVHALGGDQGDTVLITGPLTSLVVIGGLHQDYEKSRAAPRQLASTPENMTPELSDLIKGLMSFKGEGDMRWLQHVILAAQLLVEET